MAVPEQDFTLDVDWNVRVGGSLFYDRDFDGVPDSNELFPTATIELWDELGEKILQSINPDSMGNYEFFLSPQNVQLYAYRTIIYENMTKN